MADTHRHRQPRRSRWLKEASIRTRPVRNRIVALVGPWLVRLWLGSIRYRWRGPGCAPSDRAVGRGRIFIIWHQRLLAFVYTHRGRQSRVLISPHGDGEMLAGIMERLGFRAVRGSSNRRGAQALRELLADRDSGFDYGWIPDGPTGPAEVCKAGPIYFASASGLPLVPTTASFSRQLQFRSWDRFVLPLPFCRATLRFGEEIWVPPGLGPRDIEEWRQRVERTLRELTAETDRCFEEIYRSGQRPGACTSEKADPTA